jgi:uncharacterized protein (TIGR00661 family)
MRILIGVQGTGNGHLSRCSALAEALAKYLQVQVDYLLSGRDREGYFDVQAFGDWQWRQGLSFVVKDSRLAIRETLRRNQWQTFWNDVNALELSAYDLIVSDYEPVTAWAGRKQQRRVIGMGRQYAFYDRAATLDIHPTQRALLRWFAPVTDVIGMHWLPDAPHILPPIVHQRGEIMARESAKILVYLPFEPLSAVHKLLQGFSDYQFSVFHPDAHAQIIGNIQYFPLSRVGFAQQFSSATGVISNAGFETACEALSQGKQLLVRPLSGQFEQQANARCLSEYGLATVMRELDRDAVSKWLVDSNGRSARQVSWPNVAKRVAEWLADGACQPINELSRSLWNDAELNDYMDLLKRG